MVHHNAASIMIQPHSCTQLEAWRRSCSIFFLFSKAPSAGAVPLLPTRFRRIVLPMSDHQSLYTWANDSYFATMPERKRTTHINYHQITVTWYTICRIQFQWMEENPSLWFFRNLSQQAKLPISRWTTLNISELCVPTLRNIPWHYRPYTFSNNSNQ